MQKYLLLIVCLLSFNALNAQSYTSGHLHAVQVDTMSHDSTTCMGTVSFHYHITVDSSFAGDSVIVVDTYWHTVVGTYYNTTGASPWVFDETGYGYSTYDIGITSGGGYMTFSGLVLKIASTSDTIPAVMFHDSLYVSDPCDWSYVSGQVYADNNSNCVFDAGDAPLHSFTIDCREYVSSPVDSISWGPQLYLDTSSWYMGGYSFNIQKSWMVNYKISMPPAFAFIFPTSPCFSGTGYVMDTVGCTTADFPLNCTSSIDVQCGALTPEKVRAHNSFFLRPNVANTGCDLASGTLTLVLDSRVTYDPSLSILPADTVHGDTLIWNYTGINSLSGGAYWNSFPSSIHLTPDSTVTMGDTLCFIAYTGVLPADVDPANNYYAFCLPVVYSFDPNSKTVSPIGTGPEGYIPAAADTLTYTIHFQNTGSDYAEDVRVVDTLNSNFDMHSLKILGSSHTMVPKWLAWNVVEFDFENIYLPDSFVNEPGSNGQLSFSIVLNPGVALGTPIKNTGYIYFDINPPVITNTTLNTISLHPVEVLPVALPSVSIYPNPATDNITVDNLHGGTITIMNLNSQVVMTKDVSGNKMNVDVSRLPNGVYLLKAVNEANSSTVKFTKY